MHECEEKKQKVICSVNQFNCIREQLVNHYLIMTYFYVKALHIIFIVTWFSGMFYIVRLFIYNCEAEDAKEPEKRILHDQFNIMIKRLWFGITWPSAILSMLFGSWMLFLTPFIPDIYNLGSYPTWLIVKLGFVLGLYAYHFSLHHIYKQQIKGVFNYSSQQLRIWNEVSTVFLIAIVFLIVVKQGISMVYGLSGLLLFTIIIMSSITIYKNIRSKKDKI